MNESYHEGTLTLNVSYYSSYRDFKLFNFQYWPFFISCISLIVGEVFTGGSSITVFLLFFSLFLGFLYVLGTRFYANSILSISDQGLKIIQGAKIVDFNWSDISNIAVLTSWHGHSYLEIILVIYTKNNDVEYIFIESLNFIIAKSRVRKIQPAIEKHMGIKELLFN